MMFASMLILTFGFQAELRDYLDGFTPRDTAEHAFADAVGPVMGKQSLAQWLAFYDMPCADLDKTYAQMDVDGSGVSFAELVNEMQGREASLVESAQVKKPENEKDWEDDDDMLSAALEGYDERHPEIQKEDKDNADAADAVAQTGLKMCPEDAPMCWRHNPKLPKPHWEEGCYVIKYVMGGYGYYLEEHTRADPHDCTQHNAEGLKKLKKAYKDALPASKGAKKLDSLVAEMDAAYKTAIAVSKKAYVYDLLRGVGYNDLAKFHFSIESNKLYRHTKSGGTAREDELFTWLKAIKQVMKVGRAAFEPHSTAQDSGSIRTVKTYLKSNLGNVRLGLFMGNLETIVPEQ